MNKWLAKPILNIDKVITWKIKYVIQEEKTSISLNDAVGREKEGKIKTRRNKKGHWKEIRVALKFGIIIIIRITQFKERRV